ncbi:MAG: hypothetical protein LBQ41_02095 [Candidatus Ancillula sp.]|jgi:uncharacterized membrane protein|nr:hypothetical protein [Candidatus Ancillula sp.]
MKQFERLEQLGAGTKGVLQSRCFVAGLYVLAGFGGLFASWNLAVDRLIRLVNAASADQIKLPCDISAEVSCSGVDESWQASLLHFGGVEVPNAFIGLMAYSVLITVGVSLFAGVKFPKWFNIAAFCGQSVMLVFAYWLFSQSLFSLLQKPGEIEFYGKLCPWCVLLMVSTTVMFWMLTHILVVADEDGALVGFPKRFQSAFSGFIKNYMWYLVLLMWLVIIVVVLLFKYHETFLGV